MAGVLGAVVGPLGTWFVGIGLIVSVLGAYLAWSLLAAEVLFSAAKSELVPRALSRENANRVPAAALWLTKILVQLLLILTLFAQEAFNLALDMTSEKTLIPHVLVAAFALKLALTGETYGSDTRERNRERIWALLARIYSVFMLLAGGVGHQRLTPSNNDDLLFADVLCVEMVKGDHFDFMAKMRERGVGVVEMHNRLAETVAIPAARDRILDRKITPSNLGLGLMESTRAYYKFHPGFANARIQV